MYSNDIQLRVRYSETDQMGFAYYGVYAAWFEVGRVEALRQLKIVYSDLENQQILLPVSHYAVKYIRPLKYDDHFTLKTVISELSATRIVFKYQVTREDELCTEAETTLFFFSGETKKPMRCPEAITRVLAPYF